MPAVVLMNRLKYLVLDESGIRCTTLFRYKLCSGPFLQPLKIPIYNMGNNKISCVLKIKVNLIAKELRINLKNCKGTWIGFTYLTTYWAPRIALHLGISCVFLCRSWLSPSSSDTMVLTLCRSVRGRHSCTFYLPCYKL